MESVIKSLAVNGQGKIYLLTHHDEIIRIGDSFDTEIATGQIYKLVKNEEKWDLKPVANNELEK